MMKRLLFAVLAVLIPALSVSAGVTVTPVARIDLLGGQYGLSGISPDSIGGNLDVFVAPVVNFSPRFALLPIYTGSYSGTKDVRELVGGGTLTRELQDHSLALKLVAKLPNDWKVKSRIGYKIEYLKETKGESWGSGLFDYQKLIGGFEAEKGWGSWNGRAGVDYYTMRYPNYRSLASEDTFETSLDTTTFTEISNQAGTDVLDHAAVAGFLEAARRISENTTALAHYDLILKNFRDQRTVQSSGEFSSALRQDQAHSLTLGLTFATPRLVLSLNDIVQYYDSNQNSFDMALGEFIPGYYDFLENSFAPSLTFSLGSGGKPAKLSLFWMLTARSYAGRPAQNPDGTKKGESISQTINTTGFSLLCPLSGSLSAKFTASYRDSASNMKFENNYKYNYYTFNYFFGINYEL